MAHAQSVSDIRERAGRELTRARMLRSQVQALNEDLRALLRRAIYPNEPGTIGATPTETELLAIENRIQPWQNDFERMLADFEASGPSMLEREALLVPHLALLNSGMELLSNLHLTRVSARLTVSDAFLAQAFHIPAPLAQSLQANLEGQGNSPLKIEDIGANVFAVSLQPHYFLGQEMGALAMSGPYGPETSQLLSFAQLQAANQGVNSLAVIRDLLGETVALPAPTPLPARLRRLAPAARSLNDRLADQLNHIQRNRLKEALAQTFPAVQSALLPPLLSSEALARQILSTQVFGRSRGATPEAIRVLTQIFSEKERSFRAEVSLQLLGDLPADRTGILARMRQATEEWATSPLFEVLTEQQALGTLEFGPSAQLAVEQALQSIKDALHTHINDRHLEEWLRTAYAHAEQMRLDQRHRWIANLYRSALAVTLPSQHVGEFDPATLFVALVNRDEQLTAPFRNTVSDRLVEAMRTLEATSPGLASNTWEAVRHVYGERLTELCEGERVVVNNLPNLALAEACLGRHEFRPPAARYAAFPAAVANHLRTEAANRLRAELRGLIDLGRQLGLQRRNVPTRLDLFELEAKDREAYLMVHSLGASNRFPFLSLSLPPHHPGVGEHAETLAVVLARQSRRRVELDAAGVATAWQVLEPALRLLDQQVRQRMERLANAPDWNAIRGDARVMISERLILDPDQVYSVTQQTLASRLEEHSVVDSLYDRYLEPFMSDGTTAIFLAYAVNAGARLALRRFGYGPFGTAFSHEVLNPLNTAFMRSLVVFGTLSTIYLDHRTREAEAMALAASSAAASDLVGLGAPSYLATLAYRGDASHQRTMTRIFMAGDLLFAWAPYIAWPLMRPLASPVIDAATTRFFVARLGAAARNSAVIRQDLEALAVLGLPPGTWSGISEAAQLARSAPGLSSETLRSIEAAERHLLARARSGEALWSIRDLLLGSRLARSLTDSERRLRELRGAA